MGIPGIYKELGPGKRISLANLSVEHLEKTNQRFRLAIDISIWQFQMQSGQGGRNPALRTLYYRILKLLGLGICPLFVFDGPYKPTCKRNVKTAPNTACLDNFATKQLLTRFGIPYHDAPGEAEAECALLQKEGIVDAVLSEDVDTMMFGCTMTLRNWTSEGGRKRKPPTHVTMYTAESNEKAAGLDSQGMMLVALMSGGDYNTKGLANCGTKIACEAARAGFGRELCQLAKDDREGWTKWRARLQHELHTNESEFFKQKHKNITIPEMFPDRTTLGYYMRPAISSSERVIRLRESIRWKADINLPELRAFVAEAFNWTYLIGAKYFIRTLAPVLLAHSLLEKSTKDDLTGDDLEAKATVESQYITAIHDRRTHWNTDGSPELKVSFIPANIVQLDLGQEEDMDRIEDTVDALEADRTESDAEDNGPPPNPTKRRGPCVYDPSQPDKIWMLETFVKLGVPLLAENWEEDIRDLKRFATRKAREKAALSKATKGISQGAMDSYVKVTKTVSKVQKHGGTAVGKDLSAAFPPPAIANAAGAMTLRALEENTKSNGNARSKSSAAASKAQKSTSKTVAEKQIAAPVSPHSYATNPWTLSKRPTDTNGFKSPSRQGALGSYAPNDPESHEPQFKRPSSPSEVTCDDENLLSSLVQPMTTSPQKRDREASISSDLGSDNRARPLDNITLRRPQRQDSTKPSPSKTRSPSKIVRGDSTTGPSKTTPRVNRKLDFVGFPPSAHKGCPASPATDASSLPSPSILYQPEPYSMAATGPPQTPLVVMPTSHSQRRKHDRIDQTVIVLRESLEGAWKYVEPWQADTTKDVFTCVEVVDLTTT